MTTIAPREVLAVFEGQERPGTPLTAPEVAEALGCPRRTAHEKLTRLAEQDALATKKVGARGRVWWLPVSRQPAASGHQRTAETAHRQAENAREQALRDLHDATRQLMHAESRDDVCDIAVDAARRIIGLRLSGLWLYSPEREALEPVAWTESGVEEYGKPPSFPVEGSLVGRIFRDGDYRVYDDITTEEEVYDPETRVRSELVLPLGEYGVLNASSTEVGAFDEIDVSLGRVLAANVQTALQRVDQLEKRRARRRELERQRDELATLNRINVLVEDTIEALVDAATRAEIEETVCEQLATSEFYVGAWIGERDSSPESVVLRTGVGEGGESIESLPGADGVLPVPNPVATAIDGNAPRLIQRLEDHERLPDRLRTGLVSNGAHACLVIPLAYADTVFGALVVEKPTPDSFGEREQTALETLGRVVGFVINATNNRQLLLGETAVELRVAIRDSETWFQHAAERLDATLCVEGLVPTDDEVIEYVRIEDAPDDAVAALLDVPAVTDARVIATDSDRLFLQCTIRDAQAALRALTEYGATIRTARAADGTGTITARFPAATSPRDAMTVLEGAFPTAELISKRIVDVSDRSAAGISRRVADRLTDKQLTALRAAFLAGYYNAPRDTTARELADSLDIAPSTLYQHLQAAHRKLLATVFDG